MIDKVNWDKLRQIRKSDNKASDMYTIDQNETDKFKFKKDYAAMLFRIRDLIDFRRLSGEKFNCPKDALRIAFFHLVREVHQQGLTLADLSSKPTFLYTALNENIPAEVQYVPDPNDVRNPDKAAVTTIHMTKLFEAMGLKEYTDPGPDLSDVHLRPNPTEDLHPAVQHLQPPDLSTLKSKNVEKCILSFQRLLSSQKLKDDTKNEYESIIAKLNNVKSSITEGEKNSSEWEYICNTVKGLQEGKAIGPVAREKLSELTGPLIEINPEALSEGHKGTFYYIKDRFDEEYIVRSKESFVHLRFNAARGGNIEKFRYYEQTSKALGKIKGWPAYFRGESKTAPSWNPVEALDAWISYETLHKCAIEEEEQAERERNTGNSEIAARASKRVTTFREIAKQLEEKEGWLNKYTPPIEKRTRQRKPPQQG